MHYIFNWIGGGFNDIHGDTREEAIANATEFGKPREYRPGKFTKGLVPDAGTFREWTIEELDALCRAYPFD